MAQQSPCEADKLDAYIYDYLVKKNLQVTANSLLMEGNLQDHSVEIDAPGGFLLEWWSIFWDMYISRTNEKPSETASASTNVQLQRRDPNNSLLGGPLNEFDFEAMTGQSTASAMTATMFEELGRHPNEMDCESFRRLLRGRPTNLISATNHSGQLAQGTSESVTAGLQQIQVQSQQNPDVSESLLAADPSSLYGPGIMQSNPGIANEGLDSGVGGHPLEGYASTALHQIQQILGAQIEEPLLQSATQFQLLPQQPQQQPLTQLPELEGDLGISPAYSDMEAQIFCTLPTTADGAGALVLSAHQLPGDDYGSGPLTRNPSEPAAENSMVLSFNEIGCIKTDKRFVCCHFSSDGKVLACAGFEKVLLWNMETRKTKINSNDHSRMVSDVRFRPNWMQLLTCSSDTTVQLWDAAQPNSCLQKYTGPRSAAKSIDFHPTKNELFCSCYINNEIHFWNINQNSATHSFKGGSSQVRFHPRTGHLLACSSWKNFKIFDVEMQRQAPLLSEGHSELVKTVCWDNNGDRLASLSRDYIKIWSVTSGRQTHALSVSGKHFRSCVFHPTDSSLLVIACFQSIWLWNMGQNKYMEVHAHGGVIDCVAQSPVAGMIASTCRDFSVKIWK